MKNKAVLEGLLFVVGDDGLKLSQVMDILNLNMDEAKELITELRKDYENKNRGITINFLGDTFKLTTKKEHKDFYSKLLQNEESNILSQAALETLAIIAYNEPITRVEIDELRGVSTGYVVRKLIARGLIKESGKSNTLPGKPTLYKTTSDFLDYFGLSSLSELPKIEETDENNESIDLFLSNRIEQKNNDDDLEILD